MGVLVVSRRDNFSGILEHWGDTWWGSWTITGSPMHGCIEPFGEEDIVDIDRINRDWINSPRSVYKKLNLMYCAEYEAQD